MTRIDADTIALNLFTALNELHASTYALPSPTFFTLDEAAIDYLNAADFPHQSQRLHLLDLSLSQCCGSPSRYGRRRPAGCSLNHRHGLTCRPSGRLRRCARCSHAEVFLRKVLASLC